jgi:pyruvate,water dikinase
MAVGIQDLIPAETAGIIYTVDPVEHFSDYLIISAGYGLGINIVSGTVNSDYFKVSRLDPNQIIERKMGEKETKIICDKSGKIKSLPVENELKKEVCLSDAMISELAETALFLDRYFKRPLDIEWCFDSEGNLYILQCRPLKIPDKVTIPTSNLKEILAQKSVIMYKKGQIAQRGIAAGKICFVKEEDDPSSFPAGGIAVTKYTTPRLSGIIRRAKAIITETGSSTGHMATVAREFGVPLIVNAENATRLLSDGAEITVDAEENIIYKGIIKELLSYETEAEDVFRDLKEYKILRQLLRKISPLKLIDPSNANFIAKNCQTYHDILRFSHEKAMQELINLNMSSRRFKGIKTIKLKLPIPLDLIVLDLGGGLSNETPVDLIKSVEQIRSVPMQAIVEGLTLPGVWSTQPMQLGIGDLISSITRYSMSEDINEYSGQNLAVLSEKYLNLSLRLGYHFSVIDTYVSENVNDNYIYFRFVGGVTENERRHLRAILLKEILEKLNFKVTVTGDLVIARLKKWDAEKILNILQYMGKLIGFSRQLDTQMQNQDSVKKYFSLFFEDLNRMH